MGAVDNRAAGVWSWLATDDGGGRVQLQMDKRDFGKLLYC
jgi:hypothetical protein